MTVLSIGDLAMTFQTRNSNHRIKTDMLRLSDELATGLTSDMRAATGGNLGAVAGIDHQLGTLSAYRVAANEATLFLGALQRGLETVQTTTSDLGPGLLLAASSGQAALVDAAAADAKARFSTVVSVLNTQVADRAMLGGAMGSGPSLADAETMLAALQTAIAAETTAAGVEAAVDAWFDTGGGGFETVGYLGSADDLAPLRVGPDETAAIELRVDDQEIRDLLKGYALAALVADGALAGNHPERVALVETAGTRLLESDRSLAELRTGIGALEAQVETALARNGAETGALEIARNDILGVDPYRTATELQAVQTQLETLYTITARLSRLSLAEYLR
ncbi:MAG: flagellin [Rhodobacter sp.]|nr:flagellin [Rhodobacter sp.]